MNKTGKRVVSADEYEFFCASNDYFKRRGDRNAGASWLRKAEQAWNKMVLRQRALERLKAQADEMAQRREEEGAA